MKKIEFGTSALRWILVAAAALAPAAGSFNCGAGVPFTAPAGATLSMTANPPNISSVGGVSTITVLGFKSSSDGGGPLPDGTQVYFTTNIGIIEERVEMQNGIARAYLRSTGISGVATVSANSGSGASGGGGGGGGGTTTTSPGGNTTTSSSGGGSSSGAVTASVQVNIGTGGTPTVVVTANPVTVVGPDYTSDIVATVRDGNGNPIPNASVIFITTAGSLASAGSIIRTNALGQASDRLSLANIANAASASVTATSGGVTSTPVNVTRAQAPGVVVIASVSPPSGSPASTLNVTLAGRGFQPGAVVSFGAGISVNSRQFISGETFRVNITIASNAAAGNNTITLTNPDGTSATGTFTIGSGTTTTATPNPVVLSCNLPDGDPGTIDTIMVTGANFLSGAVVGFGAGIGVTNVAFVSSNRLDVDIDISLSATSGSRTVTVINPGGGTGSLAGCFTVN